jgi:predicted enzyme related to lactoylglutathione lyase
VITEVKNVSVYVTDVDRAIRFYVEALGMEKRSDVRMGKIRWVELAPERAGTVITLASEGFPVWSAEKVGEFTGLTLAATDPRATFERLRCHGVTFVEEPQQTEWGTQAIISDPDGNSIVIVAV